jgi:dienelactone hydrolase
MNTNRMLPPLRLEDGAPWKQRFRTPVISNVQLAMRAPARGLIASNQTGALQWYAWDTPTNALRPLTATPGGHPPFMMLSPDGRWAYFLQDTQGDEIGHYVRMPFEGGAPVDITPDLPPYGSPSFHISRNSNRLGFMAANSDGFTAYCADVAADGTLSAPRALYRSNHFSVGPFFTRDGAVAVVMSTERTGKPQYTLLAFDAFNGQRLGELWDGDENSLVLKAVSPLVGDPRYLVTTMRSGVETLLLWNPLTAQRMDINLAGVSGAVSAVDWSPDGQHIVICTFEQAEQRLYLYDLESARTVQLIAPPGTFSQVFFTPDTDEMLALWQDSVHPARVIALDALTGVMSRMVLAASEPPAGQMWQSVHIPLSDGQSIQAWLGVPDGNAPYPTIIATHGGPSDVQANIFLPSAQAWLDHGFAYLTLNYHGSITFGRAFEQSIWGHPGELEVQDMVAAREWLIQHGMARASAVLLTGWSYGGYLTLLAMGQQPDLWAGGMAGIAVADWAVQYEDSGEILRAYQRALFGGDPAEKPEQYRRSSPITYAEQVRAPLLIIQGRHDTRTPARPIEQYEARLRALGKDVEVVWFDAGHMGPFTSSELGIQHQELMLRFAYRVLSGWAAPAALTRSATPE